MAEAALEFLLQSVKDVLVYYTDLIKNVKSDVESLEKDLRIFVAFLKDSDKSSNKDETSRVLLSQIRDLTYEIEDVIDVYLSMGFERNSEKYFRKILGSPKDKLVEVAQNARKLKKEVQEVLQRQTIDDNKPRTHASEGLNPIKVPKVREDNIVGFEDEAETIKNYLKEEKSELDVISIIGLPGNGKTTLAGMIYRDETIEYKFPVRIWVYVSQEHSKKEVFLEILSKLTKETDTMREKTVGDIAAKIREHLEKTQFLIVMDDVWTAEAWEELQEAFPKRHANGKILITSRNVEVARVANRSREPHQLRFLEHEESLKLLNLEVFHKNECPKELEVAANLIATKCNGLPLAIVVIAGILVKNSNSGDTIAMEKTWTKISEKVPRYIKENPEIENIISLSYKKLPFNVRPCFLYLGMFPEDFEIPVWTVIHLWIAEGFIPQNEDTTVEETAQEYLDDLINRNLVMVGKTSINGDIKTCRVHDTLRQFCILESGQDKEKFFQEIKYSGGGFEPPISKLQNYRRLCIHSNVEQLTSLKEIYGPRVRSFMCCSKEIELPADHLSRIPASFKLLRSFHAKPITFTRFPKELAKLAHLRYVVMSSNLPIIPEVISDLRNMETLVVYTTSRTLEIKANIWKMIRLRHLKTNASAKLPERKKSKEAAQKLQTLGTIAPESCTEEIFDKIRGLKSLGIRGPLLTVLEGINGLDRLENLEKLKVINDSSRASPPGRVRSTPGLPPAYKFPKNLKRLTLHSTYLDWSYMSSVLGLLSKLEVLKLKDNAFVGEKWEASPGGFRHLAVLHIERADLRYWVAEAGHFPRLKRVVIKNCEKLVKVPEGMVENLEKLELRRVTKSACESATKIANKRKDQEHVSGASERNKFKLYIAPGDDQ